MPNNTTSNSLLDAGGGSAKDRKARQDELEKQKLTADSHERRQAYLEKRQAEQANVAAEALAEQAEKEVLRNTIDALGGKVEWLLNQVAELKFAAAAVGNEDTNPAQVQSQAPQRDPADVIADISFDDFDLVQYSDTKVSFYKGLVYSTPDARTAVSEGSAFGGWWQDGDTVTITSSTNYFWIDYTIGSTWIMGQGSAIPAATANHMIMPIARIGWHSGSGVIDSDDIENYHVGTVHFLTIFSEISTGNTKEYLDDMRWNTTLHALQQSVVTVTYDIWRFTMNGNTEDIQIITNESSDWETITNGAGSACP